MNIKQIQETPNPKARIFLVDASLKPGFASDEYEEENEKHPDLVNSLLGLDHIERVLIQGSQITVNSTEEWNRDILDSVAEQIRSADESSFGSETSSSQDQDISPKRELIEAVLEQEIIPYLKSHGGDLNIIELRDDDTLVVEYKGACGGCPASLSGTLKAIQGLLKKEVDPEIDVVLDELPF